MSQMFLFYFIFYGGAMVFLGGAGAPASPFLAPPMPKGILGWASGAERIELPATLRSHALITTVNLNCEPLKQGL